MYVYIGTFLDGSVEGPGRINRLFLCDKDCGMDRENAYVLLRRAGELLDGGNPEQAATILERARDQEPAKGSILEMLGRACFESRRFKLAALSFEEALEVDPTNDHAHYCLGLCLLKLNRAEEAGGHFKLAWYLRPHEDYNAMAMRFGVSVGETLSGEGDRS